MIKQLLIAYLISVILLPVSISSETAEPFIWLVEPRFESAWDFSEGMAAVEMEGKYGYINTTGEMIIEPRFDEAGDFTDGNAAVYTGGSPGHVNRKGMHVIIIREDERRYFGEGLAVIKINGKYGYIKSSGEMALKPDYEDALSFSEGFAPVKINGRYGFINKKGKITIKPVYEKAAIFSGGLAPVMINGKWGYVNRRGRMLIKAVYSEAGEFKGGYAPVKIDGGFGYIDRKGRLIVKPQFEDALPFEEKIAAVKLNDRWGYIKLKVRRIEKSKSRTSRVKAQRLKKQETGKISSEGTTGNRDGDISPKTSEKVTAGKSGKTRYKPSEKNSGIIPDKRRAGVSEQITGKSNNRRDSVSLSGEDLKQTEIRKKSGNISGSYESGSGGNIRGEDNPDIKRESEYIPAFDYSEAEKVTRTDEDIPAIKGMRYVGILVEVNSGQVIIIDSQTGRKVYLGAWCISGVEEDRIYLEAGTPFSTVAKCDFLNGFYEKIKPGMKVYKKIK